MSNSKWNNTAINRLIKEFIDCELSETEWTHQAHIIVCAYYLNKYDYYDASLRIKVGIIKYNEAIGLANTIERGYHETLTLFWIWAINEYIKKEGSRNLVEIVNGLLDSPYSKKYLPFFFFSEDHLFSHRARVVWVEPDNHALNADAIVHEFPSSIWFG